MRGRQSFYGRGAGTEESETADHSRDLLLGSKSGAVAGVHSLPLALDALDSSYKDVMKAITPGPCRWGKTVTTDAIWQHKEWATPGGA